MYVVVEHRISDPEKCRIAARAANQHLPKDVKLHQTYPSPDGRRAICLWEADSVDRVKNVVEEAIGQFSQNEYFTVDAAAALGLPGR